jgi:hypothetical protein
LIAVRSGRKTSESVAAIDQLFNVEEQELILRHGNGQEGSVSAGKQYLPDVGAAFVREMISLQSRRLFVAILLQIRLEPTTLLRPPAQALGTTNCRRPGFICLGAVTLDLG